MKISFDDGSYLELTRKDDKALLVLCGVKNDKELTMSAANLNEQQIQQVLLFFKQFENLV